MAYDEGSKPSCPNKNAGNQGIEAKISRLIDVTAGRVIFNEAIPRTWDSRIAAIPMKCLI